jgi:hypothetical protein
MMESMKMRNNSYFIFHTFIPPFWLGMINLIREVLKSFSYFILDLS